MADESIFRDFIPEGEDTGALTDGGFADFVPTAQTPVSKPKEKVEPKNQKKGSK